MKKILEQYSIVNQEDITKQEKLNVTRIVYDPTFNYYSGVRIIIIGALPDYSKECILKIFDFYNFRNEVGIVKIDVLEKTQDKVKKVCSSPEYLADYYGVDRSKVVMNRGTIIDVDAPDVDWDKLYKTDKQVDLYLDRRGKEIVIDMVTSDLDLTENQKNVLEKVYRRIPCQNLQVKLPEIVPYILKYKAEKAKEQSIEEELPIVRCFFTKQANK